MKKIYVDCTGTFAVEYTTGVQRVVNNILERLEKYNRSDYRYVPVLNFEGRTYIVNIERVDRARWTKRILAVATRARSTMEKVLPETPSVANLGNSQRYYSKLRSSAYKALIHFFQKVMYRLFMVTFSVDGVINLKEEVVPSREDVFFVADAFWKGSVCSSIERIKSHGCGVIVLIYDVIAISNSELCNTSFVDSFRNGLIDISGKIDGVLTISKFSLSEIEQYLSEHNDNILYDYFYLGADFKNTVEGEDPLRSDLKTAFSNSSTFLMVGTLEPRKKHAFVLDAFEDLWANGFDVGLCIIGRAGWLCGDVVKRVISSPEYGSRLWLFHDVDDSALAYCYRQAKAQIIASVIEGFGLPLVEAMHYGKPVFASDIPVFREVGGAYPNYFDLAEPKSLSDSIRRFEQRAVPVKCQTQDGLTWDESIETLLVKLEDMVDKLSERDGNNG